MCLLCAELALHLWLLSGWKWIRCKWKWVDRKLLTWSRGCIQGYRKRSRCELWTPWQQKCRRNGKCCISPCERKDRLYWTITTTWQSDALAGADAGLIRCSQGACLLEVTNTAAGISCLSVPADFVAAHQALATEPVNTSWTCQPCFYRRCGREGKGRQHKDPDKNSTCMSPDWRDNPPVSWEGRVSDHILIPFPVPSTLVSGSIKITAITGTQSCAAMQRNSIFLPLKRLKGAEESCLRRSAALQHPTGILPSLSKAWRISQIKGCSVPLICPEISGFWETWLWLPAVVLLTHGFG